MPFTSIYVNLHQFTSIISDGLCQFTSIYVIEVGTKYLRFSRTNLILGASKAEFDTEADFKVRLPAGQPNPV